MSQKYEGPDPYELLEVALEATEAEIRKAYRQQSLKVHPDRVSVLRYIFRIFLTNSLSILTIQMRVYYYYNMAAILNTGLTLAL